MSNMSFWIASVLIWHDEMNNWLMMANLDFHVQFLPKTYYHMSSIQYSNRYSRMLLDKEESTWYCSHDFLILMSRLLFYLVYDMKIWKQVGKSYTPSQWGNYHHSIFHNPTAAVNLFHVGKQYLTLCKAEAAVTRNLIGRKIISNVKHADARNSLLI